MKKGFAVLAAIAALTISSCYAAGVAFAGGGNSNAAHACQQGGYANLVGGTMSLPDTSVTFTNAGQCTSYAAHGGTLWQPVSTTTFKIDATNPEWQDTGINIPANGAAIISTVNDGGGTCDEFDGPSPNFCDIGSLFICHNQCLANTNWYSAMAKSTRGTRLPYSSRDKRAIRLLPKQARVSYGLASTIRKMQRPAGSHRYGPISIMRAISPRRSRSTRQSTDRARA